MSEETKSYDLNKINDDLKIYEVIKQSLYPIPDSKVTEPPKK